MAKRTPATGIRKVGNTHELNIQRSGVRQWINLETDDFQTAITRAAEIRANPDLVAAFGLSQEIERFIAYQLKMQEYSPQTARTKRNKLKLMAAFMPAASSAVTVTTSQLQAWHNSLVGEVESSTIHGYMMSARAFFRWAKEIARLRHTQPMDGVKLIKSEGRAREDFCSFELRDRLIKNAPNDDLLFILFCGFHAGMRLNEIIQAKAFWFDLKHRRIQLRKTDTIRFKDREERTIPMTLEFQAFLKRYGLREPFVLKPEVKQGKAVYRYDPRTMFENYMKSQGCEWVTFHTMRHTFASLLVSVGESIYKVAVWMGDEVTTVQKHYGHLAPDAGGIEKAFSLHQEAASALGFGDSPGNSPKDSRSQA